LRVPRLGEGRDRAPLAAANRLVEAARPLAGSIVIGLEPVEREIPRFS